MQIGELSARTGVPSRLLRYYEEQDLIHPDRSPGGYRIFRESSVLRVRQIRTLLDAGLSTAAIHTLLPCFSGEGETLRAMTDPEMAANLRHELAAMELKIAALLEQADAIRRYLAQAADEERVSA